MTKTQGMSLAMFTKAERMVIAFTASYLLLGGVYFLRDFNLEFVIYVGVIVGIFALIFGTLHITRIPVHLLWLLSLWGLLHVLGGAVPTTDGVLFSYRIYPFLDLGGDFYILKYDQVVHAFLYGLVALAFLHLLERVLNVTGPRWVVVGTAIMASMGVSAMNEIMEFLIAVTLERNGVGGYENSMLDLVFNFLGAVVASALYLSVRPSPSAPREVLE